jgi:hypothetical protein
VRGPGLRLHRYSCWFCYLQRHEARRPPSGSQNPRLLIRRQPRVRPRDTASRCVQGQAHTATQTETQTAAATTTTTTTTGFAVGLQRAVLGWGRHDGCLCFCCLYRLYSAARACECVQR